MKLLYFIRHGMAEHNVLFNTIGKSVFYEDKYQDTQLTNKGVEESILLGQKWKDINKIQLVLCSPLSRSLETAKNIFTGINVKILALDILKEYPQGLQTCNKRNEKKILIQRYPEIDFSNIDEIDTMWNNTREETIDELNERIHKLNNFLKKREETEIAIVGHSSFIGQYKDKKIGLLENGDEELLHCHPYKVEFKL